MRFQTYWYKIVLEIISTNLFMKTLVQRQLLFIEKLNSGSSHLEAAGIQIYTKKLV